MSKKAELSCAQIDAIDTSQERVEKQAADVPVPVVAWYGSNARCHEVVALKQNHVLREFEAGEIAPEALVRQSDAQVALVAKDAEIGALKESGPIMPRGSDGNGTLITGTMKQILQDYRSAADFEAGEVDRLNSNLAAQAVELERLTAERDALRKDAERYRFLRNGEWRGTDLGPLVRLHLNAVWDTNIDAAIAKEKVK